MLIKVKLLMVACLISFACKAQTVMLEQDVIKDTIPDKTGPNLKSFKHFCIGYGFVFGESEGSGATVKSFGSSDFQLGFRYKRRVSNFYALGYEITYRVTAYKLKQDSSKRFPNKILHEKEKFSQNNLGLSLYNRFNFGKRGNYVGNFIDIGAYGDWAFSSVVQTKDSYGVANAYGARFIEQTHGNLIFVNPFNYGGLFRLGFNRYVLFATYRLSDLFKAKYNYPELPRITAGVQFGLHK